MDYGSSSSLWLGMVERSKGKQIGEGVRKRWLAWLGLARQIVGGRGQRVGLAYSFE